MGPKFFETIMGRKFFEGTVPKVLLQVERLNTNLEKIISLMEVSLEQNEESDEESNE